MDVLEWEQQAGPNGVQGPFALTVGVVLGPVLNFQINCVKG